MTDELPVKKRLGLRAPSAAAAAPPPWPVLVVDDDDHVHAMTRVLLRDFHFQGRGFEPVSARSAAEARAMLAARPDIPVMLLDVVMETDDAGLALARSVREELGNHRLRIILRTGQPGEAPEGEVMEAYDINDYRAKTELTAQKLYTAVVGALRSWLHIDTIERLNATLEHKVAERTRELAEARRFAEGLVEMMPNPVWYKDAAGRFQLYNRAFRDFFAIGEECWKGVRADQALGARLPEHELDSDAQLLAGECERVSYETALPGGDGRTRALIVAKSVLTADAGAPPAGVIGIITDITERKALERELRRLATTDALTGIHNRRHFLATAAHETERAARYGHPLSVVMLDIDHFKAINDTYGHGVGDEVLKAVAESCRATLRDIDCFGRLGGEEFAVLLPQTDLAGAGEVAERLRRAAAEAVVPLGQADIRVTISLGVAARSRQETVFQHLLARADQALYRAKDLGRDRVVAAA